MQNKLREQRVIMLADRDQEDPPIHKIKPVNFDPEVHMDIWKYRAEKKTSK